MGAVSPTSVPASHLTLVSRDDRLLSEDVERGAATASVIMAKWVPVPRAAFCAAGNASGKRECIMWASNLDAGRYVNGSGSLPHPGPATRGPTGTTSADVPAVEAY